MYRDFLTPDDEEVYEATGEWPDADESGRAGTRPAR